MSAPRFECPHCGGEEINEINTVQASYRVRAWGEDGKPAEYSEGEPHWDTVKRIDGEPYECAHCWGTFARPVRRR